MMKLIKKSSASEKGICKKTVVPKEPFSPVCYLNDPNINPEYQLTQREESEKSKNSP